MKALRIKLRQVSANYRKAETIDNKMTYPLPPITTVTGALHSICGYTEYHKIDVSIQGKFASMRRKAYVDYCFLNSTMDDRGILVKMRNESMLSNAYDMVASAKKSQGNSFLKGITIEVHNQKLLDEYRELRELGKKIDEWKKTEHQDKLKMYKQKKAEASERKKSIGKGNKGYDEVAGEEKNLKEEEKEYKQKVMQYEEENYKKPISQYRTLTKSLKFYEILDDVELAIHVKASDEVLEDIYENIYNLKSLGRSEDFVSVEEAEIVELVQEVRDVNSTYSAYLNYNDVKSEKIFTGEMTGRDVSGTKYYFGKKYKIIDGKRIFLEKIDQISDSCSIDERNQFLSEMESVKVIYTSDFGIEETSENVWIDKVSDVQDYIVNFL